MFNSTVLDLVILLSFTYFIGSLLITSLQEIIATALNWRANDLEKALDGLLFDSNWTSFLKDKVYKSPFFTVLQREANKFPSYIPAGNFARAVIQQLGGSDMTMIAATLSASESTLPASLKTALEDFLRQANGSVEDFQKQLEGFYNTGMDRASGWYKRKTRKVVFYVSFLVAALLNIDTIKIVDESLQQPALLKAHADHVAAAINDIHYKEDSTGITVRFSGKAGSKLTIDSSVSKASMDTLSGKIKQLATLTAQLDSSGVIVGYASLSAARAEWLGKNPEASLGDQLGKILVKIIGLVITVCAFQLGSGYWFDILSKAVNIRGTGKKPDEKKSS